MTRSPRTPLRPTAIRFLALVALTLPPASACAQQSSPALEFDRARGFRAELVALEFMERIEGANRAIFVNEDRLADFRLGLATIRIDKPAGEELTIACADLTLHYYHAGDTPEVSPCRGLSSFSTTLNTDRELEIRPPNSGPGFLKKSTGRAATAAETVFVDAMFSGMEQTTREAWIAVGRVDEPTPLVTDGWQPDADASCTATVAIEMDAEQQGRWADSCAAAHRPGRNARYFTFSLATATEVRIDLESGEDTFLFLLRGLEPPGEVVTSDDDGGDGTNSSISRRLEAGPYVIEATTFNPDVTGRFTVRLSSRE